MSQVAGTVASGPPHPIRKRARTGIDYSSKMIPQRYRLLEAALARVTPDRARIIGDVFHFRMELSMSCEGCFGCVAVCPTGALESSSPLPRLNEAACTGCELCNEFCLNDAMRIYPKGGGCQRARVGRLPPQESVAILGILFAAEAGMINRFRRGPPSGGGVRPGRPGTH